MTRQAVSQRLHPPGPDNLLLLQDVTVYYGRVRALQGLTLRVLPGEVVALGPGVEVEITAAIAPEDLHDLFNDLRAAGAEALALNEHRVLAAGAVSGEPDALRLNGTALTRPYTVRAIGPVTALDML